MDPDPEQDSNEIEETIDYLMFHIVKLCTDSKTMDYDDLREWLDPWVRHPPTKFYDLFVTSKKKDDKNYYVQRLMLKVAPETAVDAFWRWIPEQTHFFLGMAKPFGKETKLKVLFLDAVADRVDSLDPVGITVSTFVNSDVGCGGELPGARRSHSIEPKVPIYCWSVALTSTMLWSSQRRVVRHSWSNRCNAQQQRRRGLRLKRSFSERPLERLIRGGLNAHHGGSAWPQLAGLARGALRWQAAPGPTSGPRAVEARNCEVQLGIASRASRGDARMHSRALALVNESF